MSQSPDFPDCFYRVSVKGLVVRDGKILLLKESLNLSGKWELPGGGLDFGEDMHTALKREVEEEMGVTIKQISKNPVYIWPWKFENGRGMDWYYSLVIAFRVELESLDIRPTDECQEVGFFSKEELNGIELCHQTNGLKTYFNPADFD